MLLILGAVLDGIGVISSIMQASLLNRTYSVAEGEANDLREGIIGMLQVALYVTTAVVFATWIVRAHKNIRAMGAVGLPTSPGLAVGYFFIPIANLWKPYQAMRDLWQASHNPVGWPAMKPGFLLIGWWGLWLTSNIVGRIAYRVTMSAEGLEGLKISTYVNFASGAINVLLCIVVLAIVSEIATAQNNWTRERQ